MINILNENNIEMITNIVKNFPMVFSSKEQIENDFKIMYSPGTLFI